MSSSRQNGKNSNRRKTKNQRSKISRRNPQMRGAPVAISEDMQQYTYFTNSKNGIRMHVRAAAAQILSTATTGLGYAAIASVGTTSTSVQLNLTHPQGTTTAGAIQNAEYISPVWDLIASAFVRYRVKTCKFVYEPQSTATAAGRMVFGFAEDPLHPLLWKAGVTEPNILSVSDSIAFMPWKSWEMDISHRLDNTLYYTYSDPDTVLLGFTERFSDWGVIACLTSAEAATPIVGGVLYLETVIELEEFCPISSSRPASAKRLIPKLQAIASKPSSKPSRKKEEDSLQLDHNCNSLNCSHNTR